MVKSGDDRASPTAEAQAAQLGHGEGATVVFVFSCGAVFTVFDAGLNEDANRGLHRVFRAEIARRKKAGLPTAGVLRHCEGHDQAGAAGAPEAKTRSSTGAAQGRVRRRAWGADGPERPVPRRPPLAPVAAAPARAPAPPEAQVPPGTTEEEPAAGFNREHVGAGLPQDSDARLLELCRALRAFGLQPVEAVSWAALLLDAREKSSASGQVRSCRLDAVYGASAYGVECRAADGASSENRQQQRAE